MRRAADLEFRRPRVRELTLLLVFALGCSILSFPASSETAAVAGSISTPVLAIERFSDTSTPWTDNLINRWQPVEGYHWSSPARLGSPYGSGGGMWQVATPHGRGFKFVVTPEMTVPSGGKLALVTDVDHLTDQQSFLGTVEEWSGKFMFPSSGNRGGFPDQFAGLLWGFHTDSMSGNHLAIDPRTKRLRFAVYDRATQWYRFGVDPRPIRFDRWYSWRIVLKWSTGPDGRFDGWIDGAKRAAFTGPTIKVGEVPWLQFGYYANERLRNEVWHAAIHKRATAAMGPS